MISALMACLLLVTACAEDAEDAEAPADDAVASDAADQPEDEADDAADEPDDAADEADEADEADDETAADGIELDTITPGVITVAIQPYAPYTDFVNGELTGLDSDILASMAEKWGYELEVEVTDFAGMLGGVQSGRVDISIGGIAWTEERQQEGLFTDPVYYSPPAMAVANDEQYSTISDLEGLNLGTVEGYVWVQSIEDIPGATLHAYPDATGVIDDLGADRIDVGFLDLFLLTFAEATRPELGIQTQYLTPPTEEEVAENPGYEFFAPYTVSFYVAPDSPELESAISGELNAMYASGEMEELIASYGGDPEVILQPFEGVAESRIGVDRPEGWEPPSI
ncbi:MAG TPA: transporter substrate-binding domain-containing protein [Euzebya sp.]|nr:transporter substrate-binding domain-containing protein [Euzebya sp.]